MHNALWCKGVRRVALWAAAFAIGPWFLEAGRGLASETSADGGAPLPKERQSQTGDSLRRADRAEDVIGLLHDGNRTEIEGARLAMKRGKAERVKNYARLLTTEHQRFNRQLMDYSDQKGFDRRRIENGTQEATDGPLERLRGRQPQNFDRAFILAMVQEHGKMIEALTSTMRQSHDADLRSLLAGQLPVLEKLKKSGEAILARLPANRAD